MTEWQVYLGFPCLASSLSNPGLNVSGYHIDINGLEAMLALALLLLGAWWSLGGREREQRKGDRFVFHKSNITSALYRVSLLYSPESSCSCPSIFLTPDMKCPLLFFFFCH